MEGLGPAEGREWGCGPPCSAAQPALRRAVVPFSLRRSSAVGRRLGHSRQHCSGCSSWPRGPGCFVCVGIAASPPQPAGPSPLPPTGPARAAGGARQRGFRPGQLVGQRSVSSSASHRGQRSSARCSACQTAPPSACQRDGERQRGRSGRVWTPLRVECRGEALRGAPSLQPGCNVLCPPVAPCRYLGTLTACALCHLRLASYVLRDAAWVRAGGWSAVLLLVFGRTLLDGSPQRARTTVSGWPLQHGQPVSLMLWERG